MDTADIVLDELIHEYYVDGKKTPYVTGILGAVGMYKDLDRIPRWILDMAADRGKVVHECIELHCKGVLDESTIDPELQGYFNAYLACRAANSSVYDALTDFEKTVYSQKYHYCGKYDAGSDRIIIDHKTTNKASPVHGLQLTAYWMSEHPDFVNDKPELLACGYYHKNGKYEFVKYEYQPLIWLSILSVYNWQRKHGIEPKEKKEKKKEKE